MATAIMAGDDLFLRTRLLPQIPTIGLVGLPVHSVIFAYLRRLPRRDPRLGPNTAFPRIPVSGSVRCI